MEKDKAYLRFTSLRPGNIANVQGQTGSILPRKALIKVAVHLILVNTAPVDLCPYTESQVLNKNK